MRDTAGPFAELSVAARIMQGVSGLGLAGTLKLCALPHVGSKVPAYHLRGDDKVLVTPARLLHTYMYGCWDACMLGRRTVLFSRPKAWSSRVRARVSTLR